MTANPPDLSLVIPTRDTRTLTLSCLRSIASAADGVRHEIVVVDDGSTDGTCEAIRQEFPGVTILATAGGLGFTKAVNLGIGKTRGEILLILNSDTELDPEGLVSLRAAFARDSQLGIAGGRLVYPDGRCQWSGGGRPDKLWLFALASGLTNPLRHMPGYSLLRKSREAGEVAWVSGAALALRRAVWQAVGPFDEDFRFYAQDLDLCLRAGVAGWKIAIVPEFRVVHHHGSTIRRRAGAANLPFQPPILWTDLIRWSAKDGGPTSAEAHTRVLRWGTRLRLLGRAMALPFVADRRRWRAESDSFRAALRSLRGGN